MSHKFGQCNGYTGELCPKCGRCKVEHYPKGFDICEKCSWCKQLNRYIDDNEFADDCRDCKDWETCQCGKTWHENGALIGYSTDACINFKPKDGER